MTGRVPGDLPHEFESDDGRALCMWCHTFREDAGGRDQSNEDCAVRLRDWISALGPVAPPCPEGRVRVEFSEEDARLNLKTMHDYARGWRHHPSGEWYARIAESLRTALAKGAE